MKKFICVVTLALVAAVSISSCTEQNIKPRDGGGSSDPCQFGGPGCPPPK